MNTELITVIYFIFLIAIIGLQIFLSLRRSPLWGLIMPLLQVGPICYYFNKFRFISSSMITSGDADGNRLSRQQGIFTLLILLLAIFVVFYVLCRVVKNYQKNRTILN